MSRLSRNRLSLSRIRKALTPSILRKSNKKYLNVNGDEMKGDIDMDNNDITNVKLITDSQGNEVATKSYVDSTLGQSNSFGDSFTTFIPSSTSLTFQISNPNWKYVILVLRFYYDYNSIVLPRSAENLRIKLFYKSYPDFNYSNIVYDYHGKVFLKDIKYDLETNKSLCTIKCEDFGFYRNGYYNDWYERNDYSHFGNTWGVQSALFV